MKSFEEQFFHEFYMGKNNKGDYIDDRTRMASFCYEAGQQSKQAEVDELRREILNKTNEAYADGQKSMRKLIKSNDDELQKRIDDALAVLSNMKQHGTDEAIYLLKGDLHEP